MSADATTNPMQAEHDRLSAKLGTNALNGFKNRIRQRRLAHVARILSGEWNAGGAKAISVQLNDDNVAATDGANVFIPRVCIPEDEAANLIAQEAILAHEAAGHLRYTDFEAWNDLRRTVNNGTDDKLIHPMVNILEDARINHLVGQDFHGSGNKITWLNDYYTQKHEASWNEGEGQSTMQGVMCGIMTEVINGTPSFIKDEEVEAILDDLRPLYANAVKQPSTKAVIKQARRVIKKLREYFPLEESDETDSCDAPSSDGGEGEGAGAGAGEGGEDWGEGYENWGEGGEDSPKPYDRAFDEIMEMLEEAGIDTHSLEDIEKAMREQMRREAHGETVAEEVSPTRFDGMKVGGEVGDGEDGEDGDTAGEGEGGELTAGEKIGETGDMGSEYDDSKVADATDMTTNIEDGDTAGFGGVGTNSITKGTDDGQFEVIMREAVEAIEVEDTKVVIDAQDYVFDAEDSYEISEIHSGLDEEGHAIETVEFFDARAEHSDPDNIDRAVEHYDLTVEKNEDAIQTLVEVYQRKLRGLDTRWNTQLRRGKLDTKRLNRNGLSRNLFKKRNVQDDPTANVIILVDASGSMGGHHEGVEGSSRAHYAAEAGVVFHEVFHRLGFNVEVVDFSSGYGKGSCGYTQIAVQRQAGHPLTDRVKAALRLPAYGSENADGRAINWCYNRLKEMGIESASANMVFTISDGAPAGPSPHGVSTSEDLKNVAANPPRGVELFALGVCGSPVDRYYEHSLSINGISDITESGLHLIEEMLERVRMNRVVV